MTLKQKIAELIDPSAWTIDACEQVDYCATNCLLHNHNMIGYEINNRQGSSLELADKILELVREHD